MVVRFRGGGKRNHDGSEKPTMQTNDDDSSDELSAGDDDDAEISGSDVDVPDDPSRNDIDEDDYLACGNADSQILGRTMHREYGTAVPVASVYAGRNNLGRNKTKAAVTANDDDQGEDLGFEEDDDEDAEEDAELETRRGGRSKKRTKICQQKTKRADPSLKDLDGLWDDDENENEENPGKGGEDDDPPDGPPPAQDAAIARSGERCWLCTFSSHPLSKQIHNYVGASVATVDTLHMASQIKGEIMDRFPHALGAR